MADGTERKFFELVPSGTNFDFVGKRRLYVLISAIALLISFAAMAYNASTRGAALNYGIDFAGGSQVRLAFTEASGVDVGKVREALDELGYEGSSAVAVPDAEHEVLIRVKEVISVSEEQEQACEAAAAQVGEAKLLSFNHPGHGSKIFLKYDKQPEFLAVERALTEAGCEGTADKGFGREGEIVVEYALVGIGARLAEQLDETFGAGTVDHIVRSETVGPKVGSQLKIDGARSMLFALGFIFLYVMVRFDLRFAPGGIVALMHDAMLVIGAFALTWKEFNLQIVAAVLTVIGYSINDTIVVFDRVRERVALDRDAPIEETTNRALNDTLSRTVLTSGTTLIVVLAIFFLGSGAIKDFAFALIVGVIVGTYSSLFIATPVFLWVNRRFYKGHGHLDWAEEEVEGPLLAEGAGAVDEFTGRTVGDLREEEAAAERALEKVGAPRRLSRRRRRNKPPT